MKLSEFKKEIEIRLALIRANTVFTFQQETAYWGNNWTSILSTTFYMISTIIAIDVVYNNVKLVAGYSRDEMLLFLLIGQSVYYIGWIVQSNLDELISSVNRGNLDLILVKPVPSLFYVQFRRIKIFSCIRDALVPTIAVIWAINWSMLDITVQHALWGVAIAGMGLIISNIIFYLSTLPVFTLGESSGLLDAAKSFEYTSGHMVPYEGFTSNMRFMFTYLFPSIISAGVAVSIMLGKTDVTPLIYGIITVTVVFLIIRLVMWKKALKAYTSASS
jgi:ABC-2 type transport system permease protein